MDFAWALAADELWGCPVEVLDRLFALRVRAGAGSLSIEGWRQQDAALRAEIPDVDLEKVNEFHIDWLVNGREIDAPLTGRLTALTSPPPTDEELWGEIVSADAALADRRTSRDVKDAHRAVRACAVAWLTRPSNGLDPVTGLPWSSIERYRVVEDPDFGPVPQHVGSARRRALREASDAERQRADLLTAGRDTVNDDLEGAKAGQRQHYLEWFPTLLQRGAEVDEGVRPLLAELTRVWSDSRVQRLLLDETSAGWPDRERRRRRPGG